MGVLSQKLIFAVWLISNLGICSSELVTIEREFLEDVFIVPASKCESGKDFCKEFNAKPAGNMGECRCSCEHPNATLTFHQGSWTCVGSETTFEGCAQRTHFQNKSGQLIVLKDEEPAFFALNRTGDCEVSSSQYINCRGNKVATMALPQPFTIKWNEERHAYGIELNLEANMALEGKIVTTDISCTTSLGSLQICLIFKVEGTINCPITSPTNKLATITDATQTITTEIINGPSVAADQSNISDETAFSSGFLAGISVALVVLILATGIFIFYCKRGRQQDRWPNHRTVESLRTTTSELSSENHDDTYATLNYRHTGTYASSYSIPTTGQAKSPANREEPQYCAIEEGNRATEESQKNNMPICIEQRVYNVVENFEAAPPIEESYEYTYSSIDGPQNETAFPISIEQRVYNFVEEIQSNTKEGDNDVSTIKHQNNAPIPTEQKQLGEKNSTKEHTSNTPTSVEQRVYDLMEDLDIVTVEIPTNQKPNRKRSVEQRGYSLVNEPETTISQSPCDNDSGNNKRKTAPLSVEQRLYSLVENLGTRTYEELHNFETKHPECRVLERPSSNSVCTRDADGQCTIDKRATTL